MFEFAASYPWLIPALPLLACLVIAAFGWKMKGASHWPALVAMAASFALAMALLVGISADPSRTIVNMHVFEWFSAGNFHAPFAVTIDQLTSLYLAFVTGVGLLIFIFTVGYMKGDYGYWRFFAYLSLFVFFMCCLVMANNFLVLYLGWEGVGVASYLLIGYYYPRPAAVAAAKKAFIVNRIGDVGLSIGIYLIYRSFGTVEFSGIFAQLADPAQQQWLRNMQPVLQYIPFCLMLGAFGKSAQFPLHVWLPDAMEGPTPVSALIHAATMVTAGIYLIAHTMPIFGNAIIDPMHHALNTVACVGAFTAFMAASMALCQYDLKRIWAYSTLSQLGYMFLGLGVLATSSAVFHVFTHAFFKALLFLSAGSVMHAMGGELDIRKMSGIRRVMPITNVTMLLGCIALAGVPFIGAGYFSKDEIIGAALNSAGTVGFPLGIVGLIVALMTAFYTFRLYFKVFWGPLELPATAGHHEPSPFALETTQAHGEEQAQGGVDTVHAKQGYEESTHGKEASGAVHAASGHHEAGAHGPSDGSPWLWVPLVVLSIGAVGAGYLGYSGTGDWLHRFLAPVFGMTPAFAGPGVERVGESLMMALGFLMPLAGIALAWYFFLQNRRASAAVGARLRPVVNFLYNRWYIDALYRVLITKTLWILAHILSLIDRYLVDGIVFLVGFVPQLAGYTLKPTERGLLQRYAVGMIAGMAAVIVGVLYLLR